MIVVTDNGTVIVGGGDGGVDEEPTPTSPERRPQLGFTWTGGDGQEWDVAHGKVGLLSGARGFGLPVPQHWTADSLLNGAQWNGLRFPAREVFLPVTIETTPFADIIGTERAFFAGLDPRTEGTLRVTQPNGQWREIVCRYLDGAEGEYETDPMLTGRSVHSVRMTANDPFWRGEPVVARFAYPDSTPSFFTGPPFRLAPSEVLGASTVENPGDVDAYALWRIDGPFTDFTVGVGDSVVTMSLPKAAGEWVEINMNPTELTILDELGEDQWSAAEDVSFGAIPPGEVELQTVVTGAAPGSAVEVSFTPRYLRAW